MPEVLSRIDCRAVVRGQLGIFGLEIAIRIESCHDADPTTADQAMRRGGTVIASGGHAAPLATSQRSVLGCYGLDRSPPRREDGIQLKLRKDQERDLDGDDMVRGEILGRVVDRWVLAGDVW
ncbi:hypothetical protein MMC09_000844 [Bachmanniomyces sp. S44760]|nr:hypothetical protein [Bachmanniomyces sp. S44760]